MIATLRGPLVTVIGLSSLAAAAAAVIADQGWLVLVAAVLALTAVVLVSVRSRHRPDTPAVPLPDDEADADAAKGDASPMAAQEAGSGGSVAGSEPAPSGVGTPPAGGLDPPTVDLCDRERGSDGVTDPTTGLFNQVFFDASLVKRVSAARRALRPLSVAVVDVVTRVGSEDDASAPGAAPALAPDVGRTMLGALREADIVARADDGLFLVLLEDTPENGAVWTLERLRRRLVEEVPGHTVRVGVSCYPAYGFSAAQLTGQARRALDAAREWHQDRIEVTAEDPDG